MSQQPQSAHSLGLPDWLIFLRIAQGAMALLILILSAIAANKYLNGADVSYLVSIPSHKVPNRDESKV